MKTAFNRVTSTSMLFLILSGGVFAQTVRPSVGALGREIAANNAEVAGHQYPFATSFMTTLSALAGAFGSYFFFD